MLHVAVNCQLNLNFECCPIYFIKKKNLYSNYFHCRIHRIQRTMMSASVTNEIKIYDDPFIYFVSPQFLGGNIIDRSTISRAHLKLARKTDSMFDFEKKRIYAFTFHILYGLKRFKFAHSKTSIHYTYI